MSFNSGQNREQVGANTPPSEQNETQGQEEEDPNKENTPPLQTNNPQPQHITLVPRTRRPLSNNPTNIYQGLQWHPWLRYLDDLVYRLLVPPRLEHLDFRRSFLNLNILDLDGRNGHNTERRDENENEETPRTCTVLSPSRVIRKRYWRKYSKSDGKHKSRMHHPDGRLPYERHCENTKQV